MVLLAEVDAPLEGSDDEGDGDQLSLAVRHLLLVYRERLRDELIAGRFCVEFTSFSRYFHAIFTLFSRNRQSYVTYQRTVFP